MPSSNLIQEVNQASHYICMPSSANSGLTRCLITFQGVGLMYIQCLPARCMQRMGSTGQGAERARQGGTAQSSLFPAGSRISRRQQSRSEQLIHCICYTEARSCSWQPLSGQKPTTCKTRTVAGVLKLRVCIEVWATEACMIAPDLQCKALSLTGWEL